MATQSRKVEGSATPAIVVALIGIVVLGITVTIFFRILHTAQEDAAYRYTEIKNRGNQMKAICDSNAKINSALKIWIEQQQLKVKPPPDLLVQTPCVAVVEKEQ